MGGFLSSDWESFICVNLRKINKTWCNWVPSLWSVSVCAPRQPSYLQGDLVTVLSPRSAPSHYLAISWYPLHCCPAACPPPPYQSELLVGCRPSSAIILRNLHSLGDSLKNMKIEKFNLQHMGWLQIIEGKSSFKFFLLNSLSCYKDKQQRQRMNFSFIRMDQSIHFIWIFQTSS